jgi:predicted O-methyltransferase YrrM
MISTSLADIEIEKLQELADGERVLEVGSAYGYSTVGMALHAERVTTIDPHLTHGSLRALHDNLDAYYVAEVVDIRVGTSQQILPELARDGARFDMAFLDGDHTEQGLTHDVEWARRLVRPGGVIACHDYDEATCPGVRAALDKLYPSGPAELVNTLYIIEVRA